MTRRTFGIILTLLALFLAGCSTAQGTLETVDPVAAADLLESDTDVVVLDIRTPEEYAEGIVSGASNIDFYAADFAAQLDQLDKGAHYVVYCRSGNRSGQAMKTFADLGFTAVTEIDGGIVNWAANQLPISVP